MDFSKMAEQMGGMGGMPGGGGGDAPWADEGGDAGQVLSPLSSSHTRVMPLPYDSHDTRRACSKKRIYFDTECA